MNRTNGELDAAVLAYRQDPTKENRQRALAAAQAHADHFYAEQTGEYIARTKGKRSETTHQAAAHRQG